MNNAQHLQALSLDLFRVAIGYQRGSTKMAERFLHEAINQKESINIVEVKPYMRTILKSISIQNITKENAEDALMYGVLIQNYCRKYFENSK